MANILVIRLSAFGDAAILVPVLYSVAKAHPNDTFSILTKKAFAPLFKGLLPNIHTIPLDTNGQHKGLKGLLKITKQLSEMNFSYLADVHDVLRTKIIRNLLRYKGVVSVHIDKARKQKKEIIRTKKLKPLQPTANRYMDVFGKLGFNCPLTFDSIYQNKEIDFDRLNTVIPHKQGKWIGIAPFAKHQGKIYPLDKMENVIEALSKTNIDRIFLFGNGKNENEVFIRWQTKYPHLFNTINKFDLQDELLLISKLDIMVSMDSANMHLASLVNTPVISIWGATHPCFGFYGYNQNPDNAIQIELNCRPCSVFGDKPCQRKDYACLNQIKEEAIIQKIKSCLA